MLVECEEDVEVRELVERDERRGLGDCDGVRVGTEEAEMGGGAREGGGSEEREVRCRAEGCPVCTEKSRERLDVKEEKAIVLWYVGHLFFDVLLVVWYKEVSLC